MLLSKMHFAISLAEAGNNVFFVNPPGANNNVNKKSLNSISNLTIIDTKHIPGNLFLRHKFPFIHKFISLYYIKAIKKEVRCKIDEVWCFNPHIYGNLKKFGAKKSLLLLYDLYSGRHVVKAANSADAIVSISKIILDHYQNTSPPKILLQHGLGEQFAKIASQRIEKNNFKIKEGDRVKVGYVGNLLRVGMEHSIARKIIEANDRIEFHFWGPISNTDNNVISKQENQLSHNLDFISFLQSQSNVSLHGVKEQEALAREMNQVDAFIFLYSAGKDINKASNSHKLIEYLSTGKVTVSTYVSNYAGSDLLEMCEREDSFPSLFNQVINNLSIYNSIEKQKARVHFALQNKYTSQIQKIHEFIYGSES
jgi:hypothetical protein